MTVPFPLPDFASGLPADDELCTVSRRALEQLRRTHARWFMQEDSSADLTRAVLRLVSTADPKSPTMEHQP